MLKMQSITEFSFRLTRYGLLNAYLVREDDGLTLIDTTMAGASGSILRCAKSLAAPIRRIALTHAHIDHIGSVDALVAQLPGVEFLVSRREAPMVTRPPDFTRWPGEPADARGFTLGFPGALAKPTKLLEDGDRVSSLRVIASPGHTSGHVCYLDERDGTLFAGDEIVTVGGEPHLQGFGPWYFPFPKWLTWHEPSVIASAERLNAEPLRRIAPGHGPVVEVRERSLDGALREARRHVSGAEAPRR